MNISDKIPDSLSRIRQRLVVQGATEEAATEATDLYAKFLELAALYPAETICPPAAADDAWHIHLEMDTYADDCLRVCGRVLGHDATAFGTPAFRAAWARTRAFFLQRFGVELVADPNAKGQGPLAPASCYVMQQAA